MNAHIRAACVGNASNISVTKTSMNVVTRASVVQASSVSYPEGMSNRKGVPILLDPNRSRVRSRTRQVDRIFRLPMSNTRNSRKDNTVGNFQKNGTWSNSNRSRSSSSKVKGNMDKQCTSR